METTTRFFWWWAVAVLMSGMLVVATPASADTLETTESLVGPGSPWMPKLTHDGVTDLVVYNYDDGMYFQRLIDGIPSGPRGGISPIPSNGQPEVSGDRIVFRTDAVYFDSADPYPPEESYVAYVNLHQISTGVTSTLYTTASLDPDANPVFPALYPSSPEISMQPHIQGTVVLSAVGRVDHSQPGTWNCGVPVYYYDALTNGPPTPTLLPQAGTCARILDVGDQFAVVDEGYSSATGRLFALDENGQRYEIAMTGVWGDAATDGPWVVWWEPVTQQRGPIMARNLDTGETRLIADDVWHTRPSIDGDLVVWASDSTDDIYAYRISSADTFQVTSAPGRQLRPDVFRNLVAYVDESTNQLYVSKLEFVTGTRIAIGYQRMVFDTANNNSLVGSTMNWLDREVTFFVEPGHPAGRRTVNLGTTPGINPMTVTGAVGEVYPGFRPDFVPYGSGQLDYVPAIGVGGPMEFDISFDFICPNSQYFCGSEGPPFASYYGGSVANLRGSKVGAGSDRLPSPFTPRPEGRVHYWVEGAGECGPAQAPDPLWYSVCEADVNLFVEWVPQTPTGGTLDDPYDNVGVDLHTTFIHPTTQEESDVSGAVFFDRVNVAGVTTVTPRLLVPGEIQPGFSVEVNGVPIGLYFDITTEASVQGPIVICSAYDDNDPDDGYLDDTNVPECLLRIMHDEDAVLVDSTTALKGTDARCPFYGDASSLGCGDLCIDSVRNILCAKVPHLSVFWWPALENAAPVADAGPDQMVTLLHTEVMLDGTDSYDDGEDLTYAWTLSTPPLSGATLDAPTSVTPKFTPTVYGDYFAALVVTDEFGAVSTPDMVTVSFDNVAPVADAGNNPAGRVGVPVWLDGSESDDLNGDALTYQWMLIGDPTGTSFDPGEADTPTVYFVADQAGSYDIALTLSDGLLSDVDTVTVTLTTAEGDLVDALNEAILIVSRGLSNDDFKNRQLRKNMSKHIGQALALVDQGEYAEALSKLEAVLRKTDGCAMSGAPDPNDWIEDCAAQAEIYPLIVHDIELIKEILGG
jgi:hypothetical protein